MKLSKYGPDFPQWFQRRPAHAVKRFDGGLQIPEPRRRVGFSLELLVVGIVSLEGVGLGPAQAAQQE